MRRPDTGRVPTRPTTSSCRSRQWPSATRCTTLRWACLRRPRHVTKPACGAMRAQYYGMISEVDDQLGRVWDALARTGQFDDTVVVVTSDHGEMLGDHGLKEKLGWWEQSYHVLGMVRDPRHPETHGTVVHAFTENVDVAPTLCDAMDIDVPAQCDGYPAHAVPPRRDARRWRTAAHWEYDWRGRGDRHHAARVAMGSRTRAASPRGASRRPLRVRAIRQRQLALLRHRGGPDVADGGDRPGRRAALGAVDADVAVPARRSHRSPIWSSGRTAAAAGRRCRPAGARRPERRTAWSSRRSSR